ncbi:MAG: hypothetical protein HQL95_00335 [Magnetococcales bacterium]|nr:hypothetical protein [Magnetococcales bacterium]
MSAEEPPLPKPVNPVIQPIGENDLDDVCQFLHERLNKKISPAAWKHALWQPNWIAHPPNHGFMIVDQEQVVGVFAALYSEQMIRGKPERFCNQNSWIVLEPYRHLSMELLRALLAQPGWNITMLTPNPVVTRVYETRRFQRLSDRVTVVPYLPLPRALGGRVITDRQEILELLSPDAARDCRNHRSFPWLHQVALGNALGYCHVVYKLGVWKRLPAAKVLHVCDGRIFSRFHPAISRHLLRRHGVMTTHLPSRFLPEIPLGAFEIIDTQPRMFWSEHLTEREITHLYTELAALDLRL